jgi:GT2 family glycosyltransferase
MSKLPKVAVVILNWNGRFFLEKFLPSVYNSSYPNVEFVIGDNASDDDSISFVKQYYPTITILENDKNYGFAGGYNKILQRVDADYYVLLNSDVEVSQTGLNQ